MYVNIDPNLFDEMQRIWNQMGPIEIGTLEMTAEPISNFVRDAHRSGQMMLHDDGRQELNGIGRITYTLRED